MNITPSEIPIVRSWVIKYDDKYGMPMFVQGHIVGAFDNFEHNSRIIINGIESMDLRDKTIKTYDGKQFRLVGKGKRMILLNEDDLLEIQIKEEGDEYD